VTICHTLQTILVHMLSYPIALALTIISAPPTIPNERGSIVVSDQPLRFEKTVTSRISGFATKVPKTARDHRKS
jgi:hypothetical protein